MEGAGVARSRHREIGQRDACVLSVDTHAARFGHRAPVGIHLMFGDPSRRRPLELFPRFGGHRAHERVRSMSSLQREKPPPKPVAARISLHTRTPTGPDDVPGFGTDAVARGWRDPDSNRPDDVPGLARMPDARWRDPDSNRGHHDFQSCALPTELSRRGGQDIAGRARCAAGAADAWRLVNGA